MEIVNVCAEPVNVMFSTQEPAKRTQSRSREDKELG
jgi:hypothetical protein